ncbi:MAG: hypothetical protein JWM55_216 [Acidimicrobiaceae bacterium]|nr:hypothetical protein [Acidimicrobiaceae bacterium]
MILPINTTHQGIVAGAVKTFKHDVLHLVPWHLITLPLEVTAVVLFVTAAAFATRLVRKARQPLDRP